jgi:choline-glycine betaine transporter
MGRGIVMVMVLLEGRPILAIMAVADYWSTCGLEDGVDETSAARGGLTFYLRVFVNTIKVT